MQIKRRIITITAFLFVSSSVLTAPPAAAINCSGPGNFYVGQFNPGNTTGGYEVEGVKANIVAHNTTFCGTKETLPASNWVMVTENIASGHGGYAQAGTYQQPDCPVTRFAQWKVSSHYSHSGVIGNCGTIPPGSAHEYKVLYRSDGHYFAFYDNGYQFEITRFDPFAHWARPYGWEIAGEVSHLEDNQPGTTANPIGYSNVTWQRQTDDAWSTAYPGPADDGNDNRGRWSLDPLHITSCCGKAMRTWTRI